MRVERYVDIARDFWGSGYTGSSLCFCGFKNDLKGLKMDTTVCRCLGWKVNGKKVHSDCRCKLGNSWINLRQKAENWGEVKFTDTLCNDCKREVENHYNRPIDELIDEAKDMESNHA